VVAAPQHCLFGLLASLVRAQGCHRGVVKGDDALAAGGLGRAPQADYLLGEIADNLKGVTPLSPTFSINPENWYFVK
jgi:hypothetical protein